MKRLILSATIAIAYLIQPFGFGFDSPKEVAVGKQAPAWSLEVWSDGQTRELAHYNGKVVVLDFWGIWCSPCIHALPVLEALRTNYEKRGVVFVSIHTPGEERAKIAEILDREKAKLPFAIDKSRGEYDGHRRGVTGKRYGISEYPTVVLIDESGKIAFRSDDASASLTMTQLAKELGIELSKADAVQFRKLLSIFYERQIDRLLNKS